MDKLQNQMDRMRCVDKDDVEEIYERMTEFFDDLYSIIQMIRLGIV